MKVYIIRHGETEWNALGKYQGRKSDIPLSEKGEATLRRADFSPKTVYVSPMLRARQTAAKIFPEAGQKIVHGFEEMDFGQFEGRSWREMENCREYRDWVDGGCIGRCPDGEDMREFSERVCAAFLDLINGEAQFPLVIVAHSGTQRAIMTHFALPEREYFQWSAPNGGGYLLTYDRGLWQEKKRLRLESELSWAD